MFQKPSPDIALSHMADSQHASYADDAVETVVGPSVVVEGDFSSEGNIVVKGTVSGNVHTSKLLTVEEGAKIFANIKAGNAIIAGTIKGNAKVTDQLELRSSARVAGDVDCKVLVMEAGALLNGRVSMGGMDIDDGKPEKKSNFGRMKAKMMEKEAMLPAE